MGDQLWSLRTTWKKWNLWAASFFFCIKCTTKIFVYLLSNLLFLRQWSACPAKCLPLRHRNCNELVSVCTDSTLSAFFIFTNLAIRKKQCPKTLTMLSGASSFPKGVLWPLMIPCILSSSRICDDSCLFRSCKCICLLINPPLTNVMSLKRKWLRWLLTQHSDQVVNLTLASLTVLCLFVWLRLPNAKYLRKASCTV